MAIKVGKIPQLEEFVVGDVQETGEELGAGAYGSVEEVEVPGARVAAKRLHPNMIVMGSPHQVQKWISDFVEECKLMVKLRHPHIVQFLGICYLPGSPLPVLLMEKLVTSLDSILESVTGIPLEIKILFLTGTARGMVYLHSNNIAHRDLTARNILIDSGLNAKIADLGVSKIVNLLPGQLVATMTVGPGNTLYMPPEAKEGSTSKVQYNTKIDLFSFGCVSLFCLIQQFPKDLKPTTYRDNVTKRLAVRSEIERRGEYIVAMKEALGEVHILVKMTMACLENFPEDRPNAVEVLKQLDEVISDLPASTCSQTKLELIQTISNKGEELTGVKAKSQQLQAVVEDLKTVNNDLQIAKNKLEVDNIDLHVLKNDLLLANNDLQVTNKELQVTNTNLQTFIDGLERAVRDMENDISSKNAKIAQLQMELNVKAPKISCTAGDCETNQSQSVNTEKDVDCPECQPQAKSEPLKSFSFNWRKGNESPSGVTGQPVTINSDIYIRAGLNSVLKYKPESDEWAELPAPMDMEFFKLSVLKNQLIAVEGRTRAPHKNTSRILQFDSETSQWNRCCSDLPIAVDDPAVLEYNDHLIVAGGESHHNAYVSDVNILHHSSNKWTKVQKLPSVDYFESVLIDDIVYLIGSRSKAVLRANVPILISGTCSCVWQQLPKTRFYWTTPVTINNALLVVGRNIMVEREQLASICTMSVLANGQVLWEIFQ